MRGGDALPPIRSLAHGARRQPQHRGRRVPAAGGRRRGGDARARRNRDRGRAGRGARRHVGARASWWIWPAGTRIRGCCRTWSSTWPATRPRCTARRRSTRGLARVGARAPCASPSSVVVTHGAVDAIERLLAAHLTRGDAVAVEDPCFLAHISTLRLNGFAAAAGRGRRGMGCRRTGSSGRSRPGARAVICTPRAQNPTGASLTASAPRRCAPSWPATRMCWSSRTTTSGRSRRPPTTGSPRPRCRAGRSCARSPSSSGPTCALAFVATDADDRGAAARAARAGHDVGQPPAPARGRGHARRPADRAAAPDRARRVRRARRTARRADGITPTGSTCGSRPTVTPDALAARGWRVRPAAAFAVGAPIDAVRVTTSTLTADQAEAFANRPGGRSMFTGLSAFPLTPLDETGRLDEPAFDAPRDPPGRGGSGLDRRARQHRQLRLSQPRRARAGGAARGRGGRRRAGHDRHRRRPHRARHRARARRPGRRRGRGDARARSPIRRSPRTRSTGSTRT